MQFKGVKFRAGLQDIAPFKNFKVHAINANLLLVSVVTSALKAVTVHYSRNW